MKVAKYINLIVYLVSVKVGLLSAQTFQVTMTTQGATLSVKAKPVGSNVTTGFANMEFYIRYPSSKTINWGAPAANTSNFPGINIQKNDPYTTITEPGYTIVRFFLPPGSFGSSKEFTLGTEYEVFSVAATSEGSTMIEMMHQDIENPYVLTMVDEGASRELTDAVKFYGIRASSSGATQSFPLNLEIVLPLELTDFAAKAEDSVNKLNWQTAHEANTNHFSIEKQGKGTDKFVSIGQVKASGKSNTPQYYDFADENPATLDYYRLKMVDNDGQFTYSKTIAVARKEVKMGIDFYPNPATNVLNILLSNNKYRTASIEISDVIGKTVASQRLDNKGDLLFSINVQHLQSGMYSAIVTIDDKQFLHKVVINK